MIDVDADFRDRLDRVRGKMDARGLSGLAIFFNGQHYMLRFNPVMWLTDFKPMGPAVLLVPRAGEALLIVTPGWDMARAREETRNSSVVAVDEGGLVEAAGKNLTLLGDSYAVAGLDLMPVRFSRDLAAVAKAGVPAADDLIAELAATRTEVELERVEKAAAIADMGFAALCETARVGMREYELAAELEAAMQAAGSDDNYGLLAAGAHNLAIRAPTDRRLEAGDVIVGEITPCYRGYFAQLCRTLILGEPTDVQRKTYDLLLTAQDAGFAAARPGAPSSGIAQAVNGVIGAAGYGDYCRQPYMRTRGHGLGFGGVVPYDVTEGSGPALAAHMTMIIHPNQYIPETGYMMLGDTVAIEADGPRRLTLTERRLFSKAA
jgi:Xaa-Pro aminopeptidase